MLVGMNFRVLLLSSLIGFMGVSAFGQTSDTVTPAPADPAPTAEESAEAEGRAVVEQARKLMDEGDARRAKNVLDPFIEKNERKSNPWVPEALLLRGLALEAQTYEYTALYDYEAIAKRFPQSDAFPKANERELEIALAYANGKHRRWLGMRILDATDVAVELMIRVQERMPGSALAERAAIELADYYYNRRDIQLAGESYSLYIENHPKGPNRIKAEQRRIYCDIARFKGPRYDASGLLDAQSRIRDFQRRYRAEAEAAGLNDGLIARLDESMAAQLLEAAEWYLKRGDEASARLTLRRLARERPTTMAGGRALDMLEERGWFESPVTPPAEAETPDVQVEGQQDATPVTPSDPAKEATP